MRMAEVYLSAQGEGPRVGQSTVFVRFGGCNLRCPGWPCDTQYAIDPKYRKEWKSQTPEEVFQTIMGLVKGPRTNVCYTGGEPFLQKDSELFILTELLEVEQNIGVIEAFSNGTITYQPWAVDKIDFIMDWKLPGSGEDTDDLVRVGNLMNLSHKWSNVVKFVCKDRADYERAKEVYTTYKDQLDQMRVFYGVAWGHLEPKELVKWVLEDGMNWYLNTQVHNYVWPRDERAR